MSKSFFRTASPLLSCCGALLWSAPILAQEPSCELDCLKGFACELQMSACPELPQSDCQPVPTPTCMPVACSSDADCAEHLTCYDGDTSDDVPSQCAPQHFLACSTDADCGAGFTCAPLNPCLDPGEPDCVPDAEEEGKVCFISETRACQADSECLSGWTCENNPLNAYWANTAGESGCNIVDPALICMPPHAPIFGSGAAGFLDWAKGVDWTFTSVPESECPEPTSPYVSYGSFGVAEQSPPENGSGVNAPDTSDDSTATPRTGSSSAPVAQAASSGGGCSIANGASPSGERAAHGLAFAALLGLVGASVARRRTFCRRTP